VAERPVALPPETTEALAMLIELAKLAPISLALSAVLTGLYAFIFIIVAAQ
jgi:hypothetical protein